MIVERATLDTAIHITHRLRQRDREEVFALSHHDSPLVLAHDFIFASEFCYVARKDEPIAICGAQPLHPGVWNVYMVATDRFREIRFSLTKFVKKVMFGSLVETGAHRLEAISLATHHVAHRWLEALGGHQESVRRRFGKNGEDFVVYAWVK